MKPFVQTLVHFSTVTMNRRLKSGSERIFGGVSGRMRHCIASRHLCVDRCRTPASLEQGKSVLMRVTLNHTPTFTYFQSNNVSSGIGIMYNNANAGWDVALVVWLSDTDITSLSFSVWILSPGRSFTVSWQGQISRCLSTGMPQSWGLRPLIFAIYTTSLRQIIHSKVV